MRWRIATGGHVYELVDGHSVARQGNRHARQWNEHVQTTVLEHAVGSLLRDPHAMSTLRDIVAHVGRRRSASLSHHEVVAEFRGLLRSQRVVAIQTNPNAIYSTRRSAPEEADVPHTSIHDVQSPIEEAPTWIEIVLQNAAGEPLAGETYAVRLADGEVREGKLSASGHARLDGIPKGTTRVCFPNIDSADWRAFA